MKLLLLLLLLAWSPVSLAAAATKHSVLFSEDTVGQIFAEDAPDTQCVLFLDGQQAATYAAAVVAAEEVAADYAATKSVLVVVVDVSSDDHTVEGAMKNFGVERADVPRVLIVQDSARDQGKHMKLFQLGCTNSYGSCDAAQASAPALREFVDKFMNGTLPRRMKSGIVDDDATVHGSFVKRYTKTVIGAQFSSIVLESPHDVYLKVWAPWCGHCRAMMGQWNVLAEQLQSTGVVVATLDSDENDHVKLPKEGGFPTIMFFPAKAKGHAPSIFPSGQERTIKTLLEFAKLHAEDGKALAKATAGLDFAELEKKAASQKDSIKAAWNKRKNAGGGQQFDEDEPEPEEGPIDGESMEQMEMDRGANDDLPTQAGLDDDRFHADYSTGRASDGELDPSLVYEDDTMDSIGDQPASEASDSNDAVDEMDPLDDDAPDSEGNMRDEPDAPDTESNMRDEL